MSEVDKATNFRLNHSECSSKNPDLPLIVYDHSVTKQRIHQKTEFRVYKRWSNIAREKSKQLILHILRILNVGYIINSIRSFFRQQNNIMFPLKFKHKTEKKDLTAASNYKPVQHNGLQRKEDKQNLIPFTLLILQLSEQSVVTRFSSILPPLVLATMRVQHSGDSPKVDSSYFRRLFCRVLHLQTVDVARGETASCQDSNPLHVIFSIIIHKAGAVLQETT